MKKLGIGKKGDADDDGGRKALFGSRSKSKSPAPPTNNPYANAPLTAYDRAKIDAGVQPPRENYGPRPGGLPSGPRGGLPSGPKAKAGPGAGFGPPSAGMNGSGYGQDQKNSGYGGGMPEQKSGYGSDKYGDQSGYGADRYGGNPYGSAPSSGAGSRYGPGGYGGLGSVDAAAADDNRDALFGGAQERFQQKQQSNPYGDGPPPYDSNGTDGNGGYDSQQSYGAYGDRQLTAEEQEEEDITGTKQEIKFLKQQDVSSTRNALRIAAQAEETGRNTLARLGAQGESIHNTEKNLDLAMNHNRYAEDKARELKTLNRSMFAVHMNNPFTGGQRRRQRDEDIMNRHRDEREQRELTRQQAFQSGQRMEQAFKEANPQGGPGGNKASLADRAKYQFEADSEDEEMENEIDGNLDLLSGAAGRLNALARATGKEVEEQNRHLERIAGKSDFVDDQIAMNRARLDRIK